jgi:hypothetical protein
LIVSAYTEGGFASFESTKPPADPILDTHAQPDLETAPPGSFQTLRLRFRRWRRTRPFWGALVALLGGAEILATELVPLGVIIHIGAAGLVGFAVPVVIMLCAVLLWFAPTPRAFYAALILLLSLASWLTSNLGGFILGMVLGIVGGALALTWSTAPRGRRREPAHASDEARPAPHEAGGALDQP